MTKVIYSPLSVSVLVLVDTVIEKLTRVMSSSLSTLLPVVVHVLVENDNIKLPVLILLRPSELDP